MARARAQAPEREPERSQRLTLSELVRMQLAALARGGLDHSTIELARNAKGETQIRVAARTGEDGAETLEQASALARRLYDELRAAYPLQEASE